MRRITNILQSLEKKDVLSRVEVDKKLDELGYIRCPHCSSPDITLHGTRKNRWEVKQNFLCKSCNKKFIKSELKGIRVPKIIIDYIFEHTEQQSLRDLQKAIKKKFMIYLSSTSIMRIMKTPVRYGKQGECEKIKVIKHINSFSRVLNGKKITHCPYDREITILTIKHEQTR